MALDGGYPDPRTWLAVVCVKLAGYQFNHLGVVSPHNAVTGLAVQSLPYAVEDAAAQFVNVGGNDWTVALCELDGSGTGQVEIDLYPHRPK